MLKKVSFMVIALTLAFTFFAVSAPAQAKKDQLKLKVFVHEPNPGKAASVSYCSATSNDTVNDYGAAGWQMPASGMNYKINYSSEPRNLSVTTVQNAVQNSFATWTAADSKQIFTYAGATSAKTAKYDGTNAVLFKPITSSAIAITYVWYYPTTGVLAETDTIFNSRYKWSVNNPSGGDCGGQTGTYDLQNIGTHEFGHWIGLDDLYNTADKDLTMYGYGDLQELKKDSLSSGDRTGVLAINP